MKYSHDKSKKKWNRQGKIRECEQSFVLLGPQIKHETDVPRKQMQFMLGPQIKHVTDVARKEMQFMSVVIHQSAS